MHVRVGWSYLDQLRWSDGHDHPGRVVGYW
jgi:hypothetical protein